MQTLYIHIPFCERKCFYCSFVVSIGQEHRADDYLAALAKEAERYRGQSVASVYLGGGTPTMLTEYQLARLVATVRDNFRVDPQAEWTIEANPEGCVREKAEVILGLGIGRMSLGIQTFHDDYLKYLGRCHDAARAKTAFGDLRNAGCRNISCDLMFGFPGQTAEQLHEDLDHLIALGSEHVSLYSLTIEENSRFYQQKIQLPAQETQAEFYGQVVERLLTAGFIQYEVSNFAKPGFESRHNIHYWEAGDYIGLGIGAHSHLAGRRWWNVSRLKDYLEIMNSGGDPVQDREELTLQQRLSEALLFGLRQNRGVFSDVLENRYQCRLSDEQRQRILIYCEHGLLEQDGTNLKATDRGRMVLDEISAQLIA